MELRKLIACADRDSIKVKVIACILLFAAIAGDILLLFALFRAFQISFFIGLIFFAIAHFSMASTGGWFFAWRKENIKAIFNNSKS